MTKQTDDFEKRLANVRPKMPRNYGVIVRHSFPNIKYSDVYNVLHAGTKNETVLEILENLFK